MSKYINIKTDFKTDFKADKKVVEDIGEYEVEKNL